MSQLDAPSATGLAEEFGTGRVSTVEHTSTVDSPTDADLILRFLGRDESAFRRLIERHGSMVYGVALRLVRDHHTAEDVFQATFLILAHRASSIRRLNSVAAWLHGVTRHVARKALQRRQRQPQLADWDDEPVHSDPLEQLTSVFEQQVLDEELSHLPASYRDPIVLHFLEGLTYEETAKSLGTTLGSIEGRLKRGKLELKMRLMRRGVELGVVLAALHWSSTAAVAAQSGPLISITSSAGMSILWKAPFTSALSAEAIHLTREFLMWSTTKTVAVLCATLTIGLGLGVLGAYGPEKGSAHGQVVDTTVPNGVAHSRSPEDAQPVTGAATPVLYSGGRPLTQDAHISVENGDHAATPVLAKASITVSYPAQNDPQAKKILAALQDQTVLEFTGNPLSDVVTYIGQLHEIPIRLDEAALLSEGVGGDTEVKMVVKDISLKSAINLMLADVGGVGLDYVIQDEVVTITTRAKADKTLEARVYDVRSLQLDDPEALAHMLRHTTSGKWKAHANDEGGDISYLKGAFVILQTQRVHNEIEGLLRSLSESVSQTNWSTPAELPQEGEIPAAAAGGGGFF